MPPLHHNGKTKEPCAKPRNRIIGNGVIVNGPAHLPNWGTAMITCIQSLNYAMMMPLEEHD